MRTSLGLVAIAGGLVHLSPVQAASCAALARLPPPTGYHCGMQGTLMHPAFVNPDPTTAASLNACAGVCEDEPRCVSFGYAKASKSCYLYTKTLDQQGYQDRVSKKGIVYYNYHCFACKATATDPGVTQTSSSTTTVSTDSTYTLLSCQTTETDAGSFPTFVNYVSRDSSDQARLAKRAVRGRPARTTVTTTTLTPSPVNDISTSTSYTATTTVSACTTTGTVTVAGKATPTKCGILFDALPSASTSGASIPCSSANLPVASTNARFRIEGLQSGEGTIFEDCIIAGPRNVTTPSGGTHQCDGTNNNSNDFPGTTPTDQIDAAGKLDGFGFDGTYSSQFQDFFIQSISQTTQTSNQFWGVLEGLAFTPSGGCSSEIQPGVETEWIFDAFSYNAFLSVTPAYAVAEAGSGTISLTVFAGDGNGNNSPTSGASIAGQTSDGQGNVQIPVPSSPGCYQYKATRSNTSPSNAFYLTVVESFSD